MHYQLSLGLVVEAETKLSCILLHVFPIKLPEQNCIRRFMDWEFFLTVHSAQLMADKV